MKVSFTIKIHIDDDDNGVDENCVNSELNIPFVETITNKVLNVDSENKFDCVKMYVYFPLIHRSICK